ncbi:NAD(P)H-binding protein [Amycolatopsis sp. NPDC051128]|uniref:NAD(P)-dependent oxidoreductase n=1 Tax=Amycolatopsis sp. NPDC051128 TaxID=3155412 RepID=UPI0034464861
MRIAVFGGTGRLGTRVVSEAVARGHDVTSVSRRPDLGRHPGGVRAATGDAVRPAPVAALAAGHDVLLSVIKPELIGSTTSVVLAARAFLAALADRPGTRLLVVGGAGTLLDDDGTRLVDQPGFPAFAKPYAMGHAAALDVYSADRVADWVYLSPPDDLEPGERTGGYRLGTDRLLRGEDGTSRISMEDLAVALLDEAENRKHQRERYTVGY